MLKTLKRFLEPAIQDKVETTKSFIGSLINAIYFDILPVICLPLLIIYLQNGDLENVYRISVIFTILIVFTFIFRITCRGWYWYSHRKFAANLEKKYRSVILKKDSLYFEKTGTGKIQSIVDNGLTNWAKTVNECIWYICRISVILILGIYVIYQVSLLLLLAFIMLIFITSWIHFYFRKKKYEVDLVQKDVRNDYNAASVRSIMSRNEIIYSNKIQEETKLLHDFKYKEYLLGVKTDIYGAFSVVPSEMSFLLLPFVGVSLYLYLLQIPLNETNIPLLISFIYFSSKMSSMVWQFISFVWVVMEYFPDIKKLWDFLDDVPEIKNYDSGKIFEHNGGVVELKRVSFGYDGEKVLENFDLHVNAGEKIALVGHSGSGKTTIAKLVSGYMRPISGQVFVDGQNLDEVSLKSYYKYIGYLTQEPMVFDGTIKENMMYALDGTSNKQNIEDKIVEALTKANCDFVFKMKKGIQTQIGEKGIRLSGGERQRLAIAKLFLKNPEIIILDEPTSALDSFSEEKITQSLEELFKGRTTIIIAHRLQTVKRADRILVIENGQIVEDGNHESLVAGNGVFAKLLAMQSGF